MPRNLSTASLTFFLITLVAGGVALAQPGHDGPPAPPLRTISVSGTVTRKIMPDTIVWYVSVTETDANLERASEASEKAMRKVLEVPDDLDIDDKDVETGVLEVTRVHNRDKFGSVVGFRHFQVRRTVTVRQRDLSRFDEFYMAMVKAADVEVNFTLESSKIEEVRYATRLEALKTAKKKAGDLAAVVGATLGPVLSINEGFTPVVPMYNARTANVLMAGESGAGAATGGGEADEESGTFAPGAIEVKMTVHAVFELGVGGGD